ncbi:MAG: Holliday junction resolvase Hjc [Sulfolobales archaeon]|nr:Holliday junction resolvase Hjc [Sulfolobales archaeon]MDW8083262.1 Holliday junction resolvase Hjc [Sulfolobales archaeon]
MSKSSRSRGYRAERELVTQLWKKGFAVVRAPASGSKIKRAAYPDVVAIKKGRVAVFEVKSRSKEESIYIDREQIVKLVEFAERAGGRAYVAVKLPRQKWVFVPVEKLESTSSGYRVGRETLTESLNFDQLEVALGLKSNLMKYASPSEKE